MVTTTITSAALTLMFLALLYRHSSCCLFTTLPLLYNNQGDAKVADVRPSRCCCCCFAGNYKSRRDMIDGSLDRRGGCVFVCLSTVIVYIPVVGLVL